MMTPTEWRLTTKKSFLHELQTLEAKEARQIEKKLMLLLEDPLPDAKTKKALKSYDGRLHRLRSGDFRIFYTFQEPYVSVLAVRRRAADTYDEDFEGEDLGGIVLDAAPAPQPKEWDAWLAPTGPKAASRLPRAIDAALLTALRVPEAFHRALSAVATEDDLLDCNVPQDVLERVMDAVFTRPLAVVARQPDLLVADPQDLFRYREGSLLAFLLRLSPEQAKFVPWGAKGAGPTLLKGGPGTGKSTVALYRVREMMKVLRDRGVDAPRILFTTYTRALTRVSSQLLGALLEDDVALVDVRTADSLAKELGSAGAPTSFADRSAQREALGDAVLRVLTELEGKDAKFARWLEGCPRPYLLDEITEVLDAQGLTTRDAYFAAPRPGRGTPLAKGPKALVWRVRELFYEALAARGLTTWSLLRAQAAERVLSGAVKARYDGVVIDEAQDLPPTALRMLAGLSRTPAGLFLTADANQSIYGGQFRWLDVHASLKFQGRTGVLKANHRSTRELALAAAQYLTVDATAVLDPESDASHVNRGPVPAVRTVAGVDDEADLLAGFFRHATRELRLGLGGCAVLVPFRQSQTRIAKALTARGLEAVIVDGDKLDLAAPGVKLVTLKSAKGLEFPIVAVAGFLDGEYPVVPPGLTPADDAMALGEERRSLYVAMTRAMHALLVLVPEGTRTPLLRGFDAQLWNVGQEVPAPRASGTRPSVRPAPGIVKTKGKSGQGTKRRGTG